MKKGKGMIPPQIVRAPAQSNYISGLTTEQFNQLFDKEINPETLDALEKQAGNGNLNSIELLHNIALRQDPSGKKAENILFDLFSGKQPAKKGIDKEIQKTSKALYQLYTDKKLANHFDDSKLKAPSKLLYIIGSSIKNLMDKIGLSTLLFNDDKTESTIWDTNRMVTSDEIDSANKAFNALPSDITINSSMPLTLSGFDFLKDNIKQKEKNAQGLSQLELFPVNVHEHWILLALYRDPLTQKTDSMVFNSFTALAPETREQLMDAAQVVGAGDNMIFIEGNIQQYVPNGCGLFVLEAIKKLTENTQQDPREILKTFHKNFPEKSIEEQQQFNIQNRRELFSNYYDAQHY
jgi:deubiquitinase